MGGEEIRWGGGVKDTMRQEEEGGWGRMLEGRPCKWGGGTSDGGD